MFELSELEGLPDLARRYFAAAMAPGTPLVASGRFTMRGQIKIGRWLPFRATEVLDPHRGFVWSARVAGIITGSDRYLDGAGAQRWRLGRLVTVMHAEGPDVSRSAAGRAGAEAIWLPGALLPRCGVEWSADSESELTARYALDGTPIECHYRLDERGRVRSFRFDRWGDPDRTEVWGWHPFGGEITAHRTFGGLTIPSAGRLGWRFGTSGWPDGEFFRFELTGMEAQTAPIDRDRREAAEPRPTSPRPTRLDPLATPVERARASPLDRLGESDLMMVWPEDAGWRQDIGALAILEGGGLLDGNGDVRMSVIRGLVARRLHLVPRLRRVLHTPPLGLGGPLWVDAQHFDVADHVGVAPLPPDASEQDLLREVEHLRRRPFDRSRPLWEMWLCPGLADGKVGLSIRLHHALADGVAGVAQLGAFLDAGAEPAPADPPEPWAPAPAPTNRELLADNARRKLDGARRSLAKLAHPITSGRELHAAWRAFRSMIGQPPVPATSVNRPIGEDRRMMLVRADLGALKQTAHGHDATVNDVLMAVVAGGYRALLRARGEDVDGVVLRASVPVSLHDEDPTGESANNDGMMFVPLPVGVADPAVRLRVIAEETVELKRNVHRPPSGPIVSNRFVQRRVWRRFDHQRWYNAYVANVPGPADPLYFAGSPMEAVFPIVPILGNLTIGVGAMSYGRQFNIAVVADAASCPDVEVFVAGIRRSLDALTARAAPSPSSDAPTRGG